MVTKMDKRNNRVVLSLGGNIGEVKQAFITSINLLQDKVGDVVSTSSLYQTQAWGVGNQPDFLNQVLIINSSLPPHKVLKVCMEIELELGRVRAQKWYERTIDIDVLFYDDEIIETENLTIPHPYIQERNFVLYHLTELLSEFVHPTLQKTIRVLKNECNDELEVVKC